ncbi:50S ribosomal protein L10 [Aureliella helgolandensis]|uniref:Large ribosomal subunit protein uL10 n=1 Tax=Aureliella helgolandensis TaxID=2527968 RepID=A0A518G2I5_9BACT|nr:50S ribosomal protein L10 [Aureliella helgolandensis]QDV22765.1 50S ribosomal protein L10 [Aureliella helgolandensis]
MSKYVKNLITGEIKDRLEGVDDAIVADVIGMDSQATFEIRKLFREKGINMLVVKRSLADRATDGSALRTLFAPKQGGVAVVWGSEDFVSLAKEIAAVVKVKEFAKFELKGGVMDGEAMSAEEVLAVSKWPNRQEQISMLVGQILAPGANLSSQLLGAGATLAGQVTKLVEQKEGEA